MSQLIDLSHPISAGMVTYPGLPGPEFTPHLTREASRAVYSGQAEFTIDRISMVGNTGTYVDSPFHRYPDGHDLAAMSLERLADLDTVVIDSASRAVDVSTVAEHDVDGRAVLLRTGGDAGWGTPAYAEDAPFLARDGAQWLVDHGAVLVGIDSVNIDDIADPSRPAHTILLAAGVSVVEHLTGLSRLAASGARFFAVPAPVVGFATFPVRAFAILG